MRQQLRTLDLDLPLGEAKTGFQTQVKHESFRHTFILDKTDRTFLCRTLKIMYAVLEASIGRGHR
jgi:hypothetical protein